MLHALSIRSFILIDRLDVTFGSGFSSLTGETGAGKSIILDALGLVFGAAADRSMVRSSADQAVIAASFMAARDHPVWGLLADRGLAADPAEMLTLRRTVSLNRPSRGFVNDQPVSLAVLRDLSEVLVEIHGQHAASGLMRPASHRQRLDAFGGYHDELAACQSTWQAFKAAETAYAALAAGQDKLQQDTDWLTQSVADLERLAPQVGEVDTLLKQRSVLLQSERLSESIKEAQTALSHSVIEQNLTEAARAADRVCHTDGLEILAERAPSLAQEAADAIERTLIELHEAQGALTALGQWVSHDGDSLSALEERLFALRAAGRKYECDANHLAETLADMQARLAGLETDVADLEAARQAVDNAQAGWHAAATSLSTRRASAAQQLEKRIEEELVPLHLPRFRVRVALFPIAEGASGELGQERVEFEVETNPGTGFGPLRSVASGGELARFSLALKCALAGEGEAGTMIFDEADQGVGGAVAAAIGERLARLAETRQVFAITHSPQVASCARQHWRVHKSVQADQGLVSELSCLDASERLEEIARMLSGSSITDEARAAASKLLEAA